MELEYYQQECIPVGCVLSAAVAVFGRGVSVRGGGVSQHALGQTLPQNRMTDRQV